MNAILRAFEAAVVAVIDAAVDRILVAWVLDDE